ncbi:hypothetical protein GWK91_12860 [Virgibacillus sp. MSP4-1]|uniref:hypothetical protein n=1 Tax=Virgibacillus sp. MSP4-1 TaxID=2700081 RepID=UPI00039ECFCC|nr:hypothetical protein [Virgibacillus sp. MSP4-1]QHS23783.1 hypothetical protein GWK91_12860 [Virgibacillus sp. MSP4-1]
MNNNKLKVLVGTVLSLIIMVLLGLYIVDFINDPDGQTADILIWMIVIVTFFHSATWGSDKKAEKDEMGQRIKNESGKISYYILTVFLFVLWFVYNQMTESTLGSIFLLSAFCIGVILFPLVQFVIAKKYMKD